MESTISDEERIKCLLEVATRKDATPLERFLCLRYLLPTDQSKYLKDRIEAGEYERAFVNYAHLCSSGSQCWDIEPLYMAYQRHDGLALRHLFPLRYRILLSPCECEYSILDFLDEIIELGCFGNIFDQFPELTVYMQRFDDHLADENYTSPVYSRAFDEAFKRYNVSEQGKDRELVVHLLAKGNPSLLSTFCSKIDETEKRSVDIFKKIVADLPLGCHLKLIDWSIGQNFYHLLEILKDDLTQPAKNSILFSALRVDNPAHFWRALRLGGDIYAPDARGNPWIVCLDGHAYWKDNKLEQAYSTQISTGTINTVRTFDRWRMPTHIYRPSKFKALTFQLLLSIRRGAGRSLPQTCITKIMERVLANYNDEFSGIDNITLEESDKSSRLFLTAIYDFTYGNTNMVLAVARNLIPKDRYDAARLLADQTWDGIHIHKTLPPISVLTENRSKLSISDVNIRGKLLDEGITCFNFEGTRTYIKPDYILAFHYTYGFQTTKPGKKIIAEEVD
jgi:hypothetical protein